jgi:hypothetical protein
MADPAVPLALLMVDNQYAATSRVALNPTVSGRGVSAFLCKRMACV